MIWATGQNAINSRKIRAGLNSEVLLIEDGILLRIFGELSVHGGQGINSQTALIRGSMTNCRSYHFMYVFHFAC